jgi:hypothetical protein
LVEFKKYIYKNGRRKLPRQHSVHPQEEVVGTHAAAANLEEAAPTPL